MTAKKSVELFPQERAVLRVLKKRSNGAGIESLYLAMRPKERGRRVDRRKFHQRVGTVVFRLNKKLPKGQRIKPMPERQGGYVLIIKK